MGLEVGAGVGRLVFLAALMAEALWVGCFVGGNTAIYGDGISQCGTT